MSLPPPVNLPDPGIEPEYLALAGRFFTTMPPGKPQSSLQLSLFFSLSVSFYVSSQAMCRKQVTPSVFCLEISLVGSLSSTKTFLIFCITSCDSVAKLSGKGPPFLSFLCVLQQFSSGPLGFSLHSHWSSLKDFALWVLPAHAEQFQNQRHTFWAFVMAAPTSSCFVMYCCTMNHPKLNLNPLASRYQRWNWKFKGKRLQKIKMRSQSRQGEPSHRDTGLAPIKGGVAKSLRGQCR